MRSFPAPVFLLLFSSIVSVVFPALAGPNAGGTITLHWSASIPYTADPQYFSGGLTDCSASVIKAPAVSAVPPPEDEMRIWFAYAAFPFGSLPRLIGVSFGIRFSPMDRGQGVTVLWAQREPETIEFPTPGWPSVPNSGNVLVFKHVQTSEVVQLYLFAGYATHDQYFSLCKHPSIPSQFADDTIPPTLDDIADFGTLGFGVEGRRACPAPALGACCLSDGRCLHVSPADCLKQGGVYQGNETTCELVSCPQPQGACCFADGHCELQTQARCSEYGGAWLGADVPCEPNQCLQPPPPGACCFEDGRCTFVVEADCPTGDWREWVTCLPRPCPGACCDLRDGSCELLTEAECESVTYTIWDGVDHCEPNPCSDPPPFGACCFDDGHCAFVQEYECPGYWREFLVCDPNPCAGACCDLRQGTCTLRTESQCETDTDHLWLGVDHCVPNPCFVLGGACCLMEGPCVFVPRVDCPTDRWFGESTCDPNPCPPGPAGACCSMEGSCRIATRSMCLALGSIEEYWWAGPETSCDPNPCDPPPPVGACCFHWDCVVLPEVNCTLVHGDAWYEGLPCSPRLCEPQTGACCSVDGSCEQSEQDQCASGDWREGVPCAPNPCPQVPGACCHPDGSCTFTMEPECDGIWLGYNSVCLPNRCPQPAGACCLPSGECVMTSELDCTEGQHGVFRGAFVPCIPSPCVTPAERTSWGRIKARFR